MHRVSRKAKLIILEDKLLKLIFKFVLSTYNDIIHQKDYYSDVSDAWILLKLGDVFSLTFFIENYILPSEQKQG